MNPVSFQPLPLSHFLKRWCVTLLYTLCWLFLIRADTDQRPLFFSPPAQTNYAWESLRGRELVVLHIYFCQSGRQAVWNVNVWPSSLWLMWDHSDGCTQWYDEHTYRDCASGWSGRVKPCTTSIRTGCPGGKMATRHRNSAPSKSIQMAWTLSSFVTLQSQVSLYLIELECVRQRQGSAQL